MPWQDDSMEALHELVIPEASQNFEQRICALAQEAEQTGYTSLHHAKRLWFMGAAVAASLAIATLLVLQLSAPPTTINGIDILADIDFGEEQIYAGLY